MRNIVKDLEELAKRSKSNTILCGVRIEGDINVDRKYNLVIRLQYPPANLEIILVVYGDLHCVCTLQRLDLAQNRSYEI